MKKVILSLLAAAVSFYASAQTTTDSVFIGAGYANQVWYSLANDSQGVAPQNNWDIAFDVSGMGASIMTNSPKGTIVWKYPKGDTGSWSTIDTTGLNTWTGHYNSDTLWALCAIGNYANPADPFNLDWGEYNLTTHVVTGDSLYIIKLSDGSYRKLWIQSLSGSAYTFEYADLDGGNDHTATLSKTTYTGKNFGYYSLQNNAALDREPASADWDLTFVQHTAFIPMAYTVTGVLSNQGVQIAKVSNIADVAAYTNYATATFSNHINTIGYDWKSFNGTAYSVDDSLLYFVKPVSGDIWKVVFTGFGGSSNGKYVFSKEKLFTSSVATVAGATAASLALYPNPSNGQAVNIIYSLEGNNSVAMLTVTDMGGRTVATTELEHTAGLHQYHLATQSLKSGMYLINVTVDNGRLQQKLIVQ